MNFESDLADAECGAILKLARLAALARWVGHSPDRELAGQRPSAERLRFRARVPARRPGWPRLRFLLQIRGGPLSRELRAPVVRSRPLLRTRVNRATGRAANYRHWHGGSAQGSSVQHWPMAALEFPTRTAGLVVPSSV